MSDSEHRIFGNPLSCNEIDVLTGSRWERRLILTNGQSPGAPTPRTSSRSLVWEENDVDTTAGSRAHERTLTGGCIALCPRYVAEDDARDMPRPTPRYEPVGRRQDRSGRSLMSHALDRSGLGSRRCRASRRLTRPTDLGNHILSQGSSAPVHRYAQPWTGWAHCPEPSSRRRVPGRPVERPPTAPKE